jgi:hypothetical protein
MESRIVSRQYGLSQDQNKKSEVLIVAGAASEIA